MDSPSPLTRRALLAALPLGLGGAYLLHLAAWERSLPLYEAPSRRVGPPPVDGELRVLVLGDWGSANRAQARVAKGMEAAAAEVGGVHAGLFLGDNFYNDGVSSVDDPQWRLTFEQVYDTAHLGLLTWHAVLGNHDYDGNTQAQIDYTAHAGGRWNMPHAYFRLDLPSAESPLLTVLAVDTNRQFGNWDEQLRWLDEQLASLDDTHHPVIAIGHHPLVSYCRKRRRVEAHCLERLGPRLMDQENVDLYLSGHAHNLEMIETPTFRQALLGGGGKRLHAAGSGPGSLFHLSAFGFGLLRAREDQLTLEIRDQDGRLLHRWDRVPHARHQGN